MKSKHILPCLFIALASMSTASAGALVSGNSIDFQEGDFVDGTAQKYWAINSTNIAYPDTEVWSFNQAITNDAAWLTLSSSGAPASMVTWKFTVPDTLSITGFSWGVRRLILNGAQAPGGDDSFEWQYSLDGSSWTTFYDHVNRAEGEPTITINNQVLSQTISATTAQDLYIRAVGIEGPIVNDSNYWAVISNTTTGEGGTDPNSFIELNVQPIPEASSISLALGGVAVMLVLARKFRASSRK